MARKRGSKNRQTLATKASFDKLVRRYGVDPLEVLFMYATAQRPKANGDGFTKMRVAAALRIRAANDAAQFGHSKLARMQIADADTEQQYEFAWLDAAPAPDEKVTH